MFAPLNAELYQAVCDTRNYVVKHSRLQRLDPHSAEFLAAFPMFILEEFEQLPQDRNIDSLWKRLVDAAFADAFRVRTDEAIRIFGSDQAQDTLPVNFLRIVEDFLNYALPRSVGLPDESAHFDALYAQFERDLFSDSYTLVVMAALENLSDH